MSVCKTLQSLRAAQKRLLPAIQTAADFDIALAVGSAQETKRPLGTKELLEANLGAPATINRRLSRLRRLGIVRQLAAPADRRKRNLVLSAAFHRNVRELARVFRRAFAG